MKRVVVTGVGAITPLGIGAEAYWDGLINGRSFGRDDSASQIMHGGSAFSRGGESRRGDRLHRAAHSPYGCGPAAASGDSFG